MANSNIMPGIQQTLSSRGWLLMVVLLLSVVGMIMVTSASMDLAAMDNDSPFYFAKRQGVFMVAGLIVALLVYQVPLSVWQRSGVLLLGMSYGLLLLILIPGIGHTVNGSTRWINMGPVNIQISEIVKVCVVAYIAGYLVRRLDEIRGSFWGFVKPLLLMSLIVLMLLKQPDFGAVVVIMSAVFAMLFLAGVKLGHFLLVVGGSGALGAWLISLSDYRMNRILGYIDPWADQYSTGYQLVQSLIAFGRGEWFGVGLGNSIQKLFYLPEAHTDFVFSILAEELGLMGNLVVIGLYGVLVFLVMGVGRRAEQLGKLFNAYVVYGLGIILGLQAMVNIGVSSGLLPTKGLTLPFISYGGSSLIVAFVMLAMIMRADFENDQENDQKTKKAERARPKKIKRQTSSGRITREAVS